VVRVIGRSWSTVPGFAKVLLAVQAVIIVGLSAWMCNEYVNNRYLQVYLLSLFDARGSLLTIMGLWGLVGTVLIGILLKAGNILGEIEHLSEKAGAGIDTSTPTVSRSTLIPVLKVANPEPRTEIGRLYGSMRRWKERSNLQE